MVNPSPTGTPASILEYVDLSLEKPEMSAGESLGVSVQVSNTGERAASKVAQF
jgi:hypothetical protein